MTSVWMGSANLPRFQTLQGNLKTDVLIVGGGMAGILCAYFLQKEGVNYALVERNRICSGVTRDTTAKITAQHGLIYHTLLKRAGKEKTKQYLAANQEAVEKYRKLCRTIDCDFEEKTSYVYSVDNPKRLEAEAEALRSIGFDAEMTEANELPLSTAGAIGFARQAQFNPLKFIAKIAEGLHIYENTCVKDWNGQEARTSQGSIAYKKLIVAAHFPFDNRHGMYYLKMYQHRSHVIALSPGPRLEGMYVDENKLGFSFRNYKEYLLLGGGAHRTGKCGGKWQELRHFAGLNYPDADVKYSWAAQDCMTLDGIPYIGQYSKSTKNCFVATGFHKWGMTSSMAAAEILTDMVMERENPYSELFCPSRSMRKIPLMRNGWEALVHFLTLSKKRCPHLGCALKWNEAEESWDCPCHGSRFDKSGGILDNPANRRMR